MKESDILKQVAVLHKGNITVKYVGGRPFEYWQHSQNGKQHGKRVKGEELAILKEQIALRKILEHNSPKATPSQSHRCFIVARRSQL